MQLKAVVEISPKIDTDVLPEVYKNWNSRIVFCLHVAVIERLLSTHVIFVSLPERIGL